MTLTELEREIEHCKTRADVLETERDECRALVFQIGLMLRDHYRSEHSSWTPETIFDIYRLIDAMEKKMPARER